MTCAASPLSSGQGPFISCRAPLRSDVWWDQAKGVHLEKGKPALESSFGAGTGAAPFHGE